MKKTIVIILIQILAFASFAQDKAAYKIYNTKGKKVTYKKMINSVHKADISNVKLLLNMK